MESGHFVIEVEGGFEEPNAECGSGTFSEAHLEVEKRAGVEEVEHLFVGLFGGAVGEDGVVERGGGDGAGYDGGGTGDEAVEHHEVAVGGCAEDQAGEGSDFESTEGGESVDGVAGLVKSEGAADYFYFSSDASVIESGAAAGSF